MVGDELTVGVDQREGVVYDVVGAFRIPVSTYTSFPTAACFMSVMVGPSPLSAMPF
jgi:hypothetical protein